MEFLNVRYHSYDQSDNSKTFSCKGYRKPSRPGYALFKIENKSRVTRENPGSSHQRIDRLLEDAWKKELERSWKRLPAEQKAEYDRKASESETAKRMNERCLGKVRFKKVDGRVLLSENDLISYVPHSKQLSVV